MTPRTLARTAGLLYLIVAVTGGFAELYVRSGALVPGDAAATAANIGESATLFRAAFAIDLINITCFLLVGLALHTLLKPVDPRAALAMLASNAVAVAVMAANLLNHLGALLAATSPDYAAAFGGESADALALMFLDLHDHGYTIAQVFFGLWLLPLGYLIHQSGMFPRALGVLVMVGCAGYLADVAAVLLSPDYDSSLSPILVWPAAVAEISLVLWLLAKGVRTRPVTTQAAAITR
jgi:hypothetical protein